jgi:tripartite-type tricarboxylate transporter receptor subunit TctC
MAAMKRALLACCAVLLAHGAHADYPERPIKVVMPFPPGGTVDVLTRVVAAEASETLGKPLVLEYKAGAGGTIATEAVSRAAPDGYTILVATPNHTINPALRSKLPFSTAEDFVPVTLFANIPELLVTHPSVPFDSMDGFVRYAKANPGKLSYSSAGIGTLPHVTMELLLRPSGLQVTHVPYKGAAPAFSDLLAGVVQLKYDTYATSAPMVKAGKLKVLATAGRKRLPQMPGVPTVAESGFPGYEGYLWIGALAPRGTPQQAVAALSAALTEAARSPKVAARFQADGVEVPPAGPQEFSRLIDAELKLWPRVVREANIKLGD